LLPLAVVAFSCALSAQLPTYEQFRGQNAAMTALQPTWLSPLIQADSRLGQSLRLSYSNAYSPAGTRTVNYGNGHFLNLLAGDRVQITLVPPSYIQNHASSMPDGFGDTVGEVKYRIASGDRDHGNFAVTAILAESWPTASHTNGAPTAVYVPMVAVGKMWGRFDVQSTLGGAMPTGKIAAQGRQINWNGTAQLAVGAHLWTDVEDNLTFNAGGPFDGKVENFLTPAAFYVLRRKEWRPAHATFVIGAGMQIATSAFHTYNHNLIPEARILF